MKVEELVIQILADTTDLKKGLKDVQDGMSKTEEKAEKTAKHMEEQGKRAGQFFGNIKKELLALAGVSLSVKAFSNFITNTTNGLANLGRTSKLLGMSAKDLDAWTASAEAMGATKQDLVSGLLSVQDAMTTFGNTKDNPGALGLFRSLGIHLHDAKGHAKKAMDVLLEVSAEWQKRHYSMPVMRLEGSQAGLPQGLINMMAEGPKKMKAMYKDMFASSGVDNGMIANAQKMQESIAKFDQQIDAFKYKLFDALQPTIKVFNGELKELSSWVDNNQGSINGFFKELATDLKEIATDLKEIMGFIATHNGKDNFLNKWMAREQGFAKWVHDRSTGVPAAFLPGSYDKYIADAEKAAGIPPADTPNPTAPSKVTGSANAAITFKKKEEFLSHLDNKFNLPPGTMNGIWHVESGAGKYLHSKAGAEGDFQFKPKTAASLGLKGNDVYDFYKSGEASARYIAQLIKIFHGNIVEGLSAYNWGPGNVMANGLSHAPKETRDYPGKVMAYAHSGFYSRQPSASNVNVEMSISAIHVNTQATDAAGIAKSIAPEIKNKVLVSLNNTGVTS